LHRAAIERPAWPPRIQRFFESLQFLKRGEKGPCLWLIAVARVGHQSNDPVAAPKRGLELENGLNRLRPGALDAAGGCAVGIDAEAGRFGAAGQHRKLFQDGVGAVQGLQVPA